MITGRALRIVHKTELVKVGKKSVSASGFRIDLVEEHLHWHLTQMSKRWCPVDCMARTMFGRASPENRTRIRRRMASAFKLLLQRTGQFIVIEYDDSASGHGKIKAMKIFEPGREIAMETEHALHQVDRMERRQQITKAIKEQALAAINATR